MINGKIIKVCGMREAENIQDVESIEGIDMLGFIFYPKSPRYVYELPAYLPIHRRKRRGVERQYAQNAFKGNGYKQTEKGNKP